MTVADEYKRSGTVAFGRAFSFEFGGAFSFEFGGAFRFGFGLGLTLRFGLGTGHALSFKPKRVNLKGSLLIWLDNFLKLNEI
jgi:hypothetical protein